jgi:hypothetical protein
MGAQNAQFWMVERLDRHQADVVQNGGSGGSPFLPLLSRSVIVGFRKDGDGIQRSRTWCRPPAVRVLE